MLEPVCMELLKLNDHNIQLGCPCGREFWAPTHDPRTIACPECKTAWSGRYTQFVKLQIRVKKTGDFRTVWVGKVFSIGHALQHIMATHTVMFHFVSAMSVVEITSEEFYTTSSIQVEQALGEVVAALQEMMPRGES